MSEFDLINHYFKAIDSRRQDVTLGIGDDCAILQVPDGYELAVSTDTLVAGVHFPLTTSAADIGYKALVVNLSDLAAMGAEPAWLMLSISLPEEDADWLSGFIKGLRQPMDQYHLQLVGGDTTRGSLSITVQVFGFLPKGKALRREAARPGDLIYVSGTIGDAGLGLKKILNEIKSDHILHYCVERLNRPTPRIALGKALLPLSHCAIDISDGLLADLGHIVEESACAAIIHIDQLPLSNELKNYYQDNIDWQQILTSGDDYELCFTVSPEHCEAISQLTVQQGLPLTCIGEISKGQGVRCIAPDGQELFVTQAGYNHFK